jgi:gamma-glutamyl-gamma-aminobutyrate hydrolase PuuD
MSDIVVFGGGADIQPEIYGETSVYAYNPNKDKDAYETALFRQTRATHYHLGICRGSQLLWALNGGKLWQDISGHALAGTHGINLANGQRIEGVTSTHHQAARITEEFGGDRVLAVERYPHAVAAKSAGFHTQLQDVVEVHWHPNSRSLGIQGHPEYPKASNAFKRYCEHLLLDHQQTKIR